MEFKNVEDLIKNVNSSLGSFCNAFGDKRKVLANMGKRPKRGILFAYDPSKNRDWAINEGGGTEIQYHLAFDVSSLVLRYGLGFNTQYVQFANEMSMVDYMKPFMNAFLKFEDKIHSILPKYDFVIGDVSMLQNPIANEYVLFGRNLKIQKKGQNYSIDDAVFKEVLDDLKSQLMVYELIYKEKNNSKIAVMNNQNIVEILFQKGQIILQGPPGTGKTYTAKEIAESIIYNDISTDIKIQKNRLEKSVQFKLIQFHPAYSYEDFVRGISVKNVGNQIEYKTENKLLAKFAIEANDNYLNSKKPIAEYSEEKWFEKHFAIFCDKVQETIDEKGKFELTDNVSIVEVDEDAFRYKGNTWEIQRPHRMRFNDIKVSFLDNLQTRQEVKLSPSVSLSAHQHASYYFKMLQEFRNSITEIKPTVMPTNNTIELKNYVLIIDEINRANLPAVLGELIYALEYRGETVKSMYDIDGDNSLIIPPNLYIIGTMNTSDRSVGHIDYAIRRRFAFVDILPKVLEIVNFQVDYFRNVSELFISNYDDYLKNPEIALEKSEHLSDEFRPEDVWLGHSYFISSDADFNIRKKYEIKPILKEYIKDGILKQSAEEIINNL